MQDTHRERTGTARRIENLEGVDGVYELFGIGELVRFIVIGEQVPGVWFLYLGYGTAECACYFL